MRRGRPQPQRIVRLGGARTPQPFRPWAAKAMMALQPSWSLRIGGGRRFGRSGGRWPRGRSGSGRFGRWRGRLRFTDWLGRLGWAWLSRLGGGRGRLARGCRGLGRGRGAGCGRPCRARVGAKGDQIFGYRSRAFPTGCIMHAQKARERSGIRFSQAAGIAVAIGAVRGKELRGGFPPSQILRLR